MPWDLSLLEEKLANKKRKQSEEKTPPKIQDSHFFEVFGLKSFNSHFA